MKNMLITLERTCYSHDDVCSEIRHNIVQKRLEHENKTSDEKLKEIFSQIGVDADLIIDKVVGD